MSNVKKRNPPASSKKKMSLRRQTLKDLSPRQAAAEKIKGGISRTTAPAEDGSRYCVAIC